MMPTEKERQELLSYPTRLTVCPAILKYLLPPCVWHATAASDCYMLHIQDRV